MVIQELEYFIEMLVLSHLDTRSPLFQSEFRLRFTVETIKDIHQLPDDISEAFYKTRIYFF